MKLSCLEDWVVLNQLIAYVNLAKVNCPIQNVFDKTLCSGSFII